MKNRLNFIVMLLILSCSLNLQAQNAKKNKRKSGQKVVITSKVKHYKTLPNWKTKATVAPVGLKPISHNGFTYHLKDGIYYRHINNQYVIVKPPVGIRISVIPKAYTKILFNGIPYYYYYGTFYSYIPEENVYETIAPPIGARVDVLPNGLIETVIDGITFWTDGDLFYKAVGIENGAVIYEVAGKITI